MTVSALQLKSIRKLDTRSVVALLEGYYPAVHRMAYSLAGREDAGREIVKFVIKRSLHVMPTWTQPGIPERWFHHYTVLTARRAIKRQPDPQADVLVTAAPEYGAGYVAFVRVLRQLPTQQKEAFILSHGEQLDPRHLGVAMDCSVEAAANHLVAATEALRSISGNEIAVFTRTLSNAYARLTPQQDLVLPNVQKFIRRHLWPRRIRRAIILLLILAILGILIWGALKWDVVSF